MDTARQPTPRLPTVIVKSARLVIPRAANAARARAGIRATAADRARRAVRDTKLSHLAFVLSAGLKALPWRDPLARLPKKQFRYVAA